MQRVNSYLHEKEQPPYVLNLDPAVIHLPFDANIDIRDTVDYAEVMKQYNLGPNGGIMTALNLFTTKFDQVLGHVENRAKEVECVPGLLSDSPHPADAESSPCTAMSSSTLPARSKSLPGPPPGPSSPTPSRAPSRPSSSTSSTRPGRRPRRRS